MRQVLKLRGKEQPKWAKPLEIKWLDPAGQIEKNGGECKIVHADTCAQIIEHYAFDGRVKAQQSLKSFLSFGIHSFIQNITGWLPEVSRSEFGTRIIEPSLEEIDRLFSGLYKLNIRPELVELVKLTSVGLSIPRLAIAAEQGKQLISAQMKTSETPVSPRKLGQLSSRLAIPKRQRVGVDRIRN